jgi:large subunit ribosomal protein L23
MADLYRTIVRPIVTEKTSSSYQTKGEYTFEVAPSATKHDIKTAIERLFGVRVTNVWTANRRGKQRRIGANVGRRPHWKRAIVKLQEGDTIEIFEG